MPKISRKWLKSSGMSDSDALPKEAYETLSYSMQTQTYECVVDQFTDK
jgi:hypothetical protein